MMASPPSKPKMLASWDASKQQQYRAANTEQVCVFHILLDASPSMHRHVKALTQAYSMYLEWLKTHSSPMNLLELCVFSDTLTKHRSCPLGEAQGLTRAVYDPMQGDGTALYSCLWEQVTMARAARLPGQHILIVFTDGMDNRSGRSVDDVKELLTTVQHHDNWLCVFLGAFDEALAEGRAMGFAPGNCLEFEADCIPEAFQRLTQATQKYLNAPPQERKLLAAGGVF